MVRLNNKLNSRNLRYDLQQVDQRILTLEGIFPITVCLSEAIGSEIALFYLDHTPYVYSLSRLQPFSLYLKTVLLRSTSGPVLVNLFKFYEVDPNQPALLCEAYVNPLDAIQMLIWRDLARQSHWHLFLIDAKSEQVGLFEFENTYHLDDSLDVVSQACAGMDHKDFNAAKAEIMAQYTLDEINDMKQNITGPMVGINFEGRISAHQAEEIAKKGLPADNLDCQVYDVLPASYVGYNLPNPAEDCWWIVCGPKQRGMVDGPEKTLLCISKRTGKIVAQGSVRSGG